MRNHSGYKMIIGPSAEKTRKNWALETLHMANEVDFGKRSGQV